MKTLAVYIPGILALGISLSSAAFLPTPYDTNTDAAARAFTASQIGAQVAGSNFISQSQSLTNGAIKNVGQITSLSQFQAISPDFVGQFIMAQSGSTILFSPSYSGGQAGALWLVNGLYQVGTPYPIHDDQQPVGPFNWYVNGGATNSASDHPNNGSQFYMNNLNVFGDGEGFALPLYSTTGSGAGVLTNKDGKVIYKRDPFGQVWLTIPAENLSGETNQANSYVWLSTRLASNTPPMLISVNDTIPGETSGFYSQHFMQAFDTQNRKIHFAKLVPYVWMPTNANNLDTLLLNLATGDVEATNGNFTIGGTTRQFVTKPGTWIRIAPVLGADDNTVGFDCNTNAAFNMINGAFSFDASQFHRVGFLVKNGFYPKLVHASGAPLAIAHSSSTDLQTNMTLQTLTDDLSFDASGNATFYQSVTINGTTNYIQNIARMQTNATHFSTIASGGLHILALNAGWTNDLGGGADIEINLTETNSVSTNPKIAFTNTITGDSLTNSWQEGIGETNIVTLHYIDISPGDYGSISNYGSVGLSFNSAKWKLHGAP